MSRAAIYARLSSDPRGLGRSVREQEADARDDCARNGWTVLDVYRDNNRSASRFARKGREEFDRLLTDVRARKLDVIVAWEASRFARDLAVYNELATACREADVLYSYNGRVLNLSDPDDAFNAGLDALLSEREAGITRKRVVRTHRHNAQAGLPHGLIPYGYRRTYDPHSGQLTAQVPDETTAPVVQEIFRRVSDGQSLRSLARDLTVRHIPTPAGNTVWTSVSLRRILDRQGYLGKRTWNGKVMDAGGWEPLVSPELFAACQKRRGAPSPQRPSRHLLSGILLCDVCEHTLQVGVRNSLPCYVCPDGHVARKKLQVDEPLSRLVVALLADPRMAVQPDDPEQEALLEQIRAVDDALSALDGQVLSGELTARMASVEERRLETAKTALGQALNARTPLPQLLLDSAGPGAANAWAGMDVDARRVLVRALFSSLRVARKKGQDQIGRRAPGVRYALTRSPQDFRWLDG